MKALWLNWKQQKKVKIKHRATDVRVARARRTLPQTAKVSPVAPVPMAMSVVRMMCGRSSMAGPVSLPRHPAGSWVSFSSSSSSDSSLLVSSTPCSPFGHSLIPITKFVFFSLFTEAGIQVADHTFHLPHLQEVIMKPSRIKQTFEASFHRSRVWFFPLLHCFCVWTVSWEQQPWLLHDYSAGREGSQLFTTSRNKYTMLLSLPNHKSSFLPFLFDDVSCGFFFF